MVFVAFGKHVVALHRETGVLLWKWRMPKGRTYPAILLDEDRLIVSAMGYTYCLDPATGALRWENELPGMGIGVACIATVRGSTGLHRAAAAAIEAQQHANQSHPTH